MTKKVKYQISKDSFIWIYVNNLEEAKLVKMLNNELDKEKKKDKTYRKNTLSLDMLQDQYNFEFADLNNSPNQDYFIKERNEKIMYAISTLPKRQKQVIIEYFYNHKTLRQIARENNISITSVRESFHSALKTLKKELLVFAE